MCERGAVWKGYSKVIAVSRCSKGFATSRTTDLPRPPISCFLLFRILSCLLELICHQIGIDILVDGLLRLLRSC